MARKILHLDLDAFFCAVEEQRDPSLKGKAFAVGARPEDRGVVASCSYAARKFGIHSAMPMASALKRYAKLIIVSRRHGAYEQMSRQVMERLYALTPLVERVSIDEAFLDVTANRESAETLAHQLSLWDNGTEKKRQVQKAVDAIRGKFGEQSVRWGKETQRGDV